MTHAYADGLRRALLSIAWGAGLLTALAALLLLIALFLFLGDTA